MIMRFKDSKQYRLPNYDYSSDGSYFVTMNSKNREECFGEIIDGKMILSEIGKVAKNIWKDLAKKYSNVKLDRFQIMPDHMHVIITLKNKQHQETNNVSGRNTPQNPFDMSRRVPTIKNKENLNKNLHPLVKNSLSSIINHYKGSVRLWCKNNGYPEFKWQDRFHDRIIRDQKELFAIRTYIKNNPKNWKKENDDEVKKFTF